MFNNLYGNYANPYANYGTPSYMQPQYVPRQQQISQQAQPQQPMQYEMPIQDLRFVTAEEAKAYIVMPNTKALLIDKQGGMAYVKTADNMGQSVVQYFRFQAVNEDGSPIKTAETSPQVDFGEFIKKTDLENYGFVTVEQYNALLAKLENIQKQIMGGKQNNGTPKQHNS